MKRLGRVPGDASVLVVDDVLATGKTLCAMLQLLGEAGVNAKDISVMVVAEFPAHRGRELLHRCGFGGVNRYPKPFGLLWCLKWDVCSRK